MSEEYLRQLRQLEKQEKNLVDRYNTEEKPVNINDFKKIINANLREAPTTGETWSNYILKAKIYRDIHQTKNWDTHVDNPYKVWHTHKMSGKNCFMCEDTQYINTLIQVMECMANAHPKDIF